MTSGAAIALNTMGRSYVTRCCPQCSVLFVEMLVVLQRADVGRAACGEAAKL